MQLTPIEQEWKVLLTLCQNAIFSIDSVSITDLKDIDWNRLLQLARRHQVQPIVYQKLTHYRSFVPIDIIKSLKNYSVFVTTRNLHNIKGILSLTKLLKDIDWLPFKGVILTEMAYGSLSARSSTDIDILIKKEDYYQVKTTLLTAGFSCPSLPPSIEEKLLRYNCENKFEYFQNGKQVYNIDVHWHIGNRALQLNYGFSDFAPWMQKGNFHGQKILRLNPEALLLNICLHHGGKECWWSLKYLVDVAAIINTFHQQFNWKKFIQIARDKGILKIVLIGLYLTQKLLNISLPEIVQNLIKEKHINSLAQPHLHALLNPLPQNLKFQLFLKRMRLHVSTRTGWKTKLKILHFHGLQLLTPSPNDVTNEKTINFLEYTQMMLNKPLRIWKQYIQLNKPTK